MNKWGMGKDPWRWIFEFAAIFIGAVGVFSLLILIGLL